MKPDETVCFCFHITKRKILNFLRVERPRVASQLSQCGGAGTGCGWCRRYLTKCFEQAALGLDPAVADDFEAQSYAAGREEYLRDGKGRPPQRS